MRLRCKNTYFQCADSIRKERVAYRLLGQCILSRANDNQFSRPQRARMAAEACVDADASVASEQFRHRSGVPPRSKTRVNSSGFMAAQLDWARPCSRGGRHGLDLPFFAVWYTCHVWYPTCMRCSSVYCTKLPRSLRLTVIEVVLWQRYDLKTTRCEARGTATPCFRDDCTNGVQL